MNDTTPDEHHEARQAAVTRLKQARARRDAEIIKATERVNSRFWDEVAAEMGVLTQRQIATAIGYHRETVRRNVQQPATPKPDSGTAG